MTVDLVGAGFAHKEVCNWPFDTFEMFGKAVQKRQVEDRQELIGDLYSVGAAIQGGKKGFKQMQERLKSLDTLIRDE